MAKVNNKVTNDKVINRIDVIERKLPNGELQKIRSNTEEIKNYLERVTYSW